MNTDFEFELLTKDELVVLLTSTEPYVRAEIIANKLKKNIFTFKDYTFRYNKDAVAYDQVENKSDDYLLTTISKMISKSKEKLSSSEQETFKLRYTKAYATVSELSVIKKYLSCVKTFICETEYKFTDPQLNKIHFKNGFYDMKTGKFTKRKHGVDFVNFYIPREFKKASKEAKSKIMKIIEQIYPVKEERDYLLQTFAIALTGTSTREQKILCLVGTGSAGKSSILEMLSLAFNNYIFELSRTFFCRDTTQSEVNKILNSFLANKNIRITNINEPKDTKMDESLFKDFIDGNIKTTSLFQDGLKVSKHFSKVTMTMNTMMSIKMDSGVVRRIEAHRHRSKFTENKEEVDEKKNIYLTNLDLKAEIEADEDLKKCNL